MPVLEKKKAKDHLDHLLKIFDQIYAGDYQVVIFDRFHLTSVVVTNATVKEYAPIEEKLLSFNPLIIFLEIDENKIPERIFTALKHRSISWQKHVRKKGTDQEIADSYIKTQKILLANLKKSKLPYKIYDATNSNYDAIAQDIFEREIKSEI